MYPQPFPPLPTDTDDAAKSVFNIENVYLSIGDQIEDLFEGINLVGLDASGGKPTITLSMLAMVTIFQIAENIPDRLAAEAVRRRTDWKYALHLPLAHPGIDPVALCEFRHRLLDDPTGQRVFHDMLVRLTRVGLMKSRTIDLLDVMSYLLFVCQLTQVDWLAQAFGQALEYLAAYQPELLRKMTLPHWYERYNRRLESIVKTHSAKDLGALAVVMGKDTLHLLRAIRECENPDLIHMPEIQALGRIYDQQFRLDGDEIEWRAVCSECIGPDIVHRVEKQL